MKLIFIALLLTSCVTTNSQMTAQQLKSHAYEQCKTEEGLNILFCQMSVVNKYCQKNSNNTNEICVEVQRLVKAGVLEKL